MATIVKYTDEQVMALRSAYEANPTEATVQAMAVALSKTVRSVVAKLAQLGIYKSKDTVKANQTRKKADLVARIAEMSQLDVEGLASLEKADRMALLNLHNFMERQVNALRESLDAEFETNTGASEDRQY